MKKLMTYLFVAACIVLLGLFSLLAAPALVENQHYELAWATRHFGGLAIFIAALVAAIAVGEFLLSRRRIGRSHS